MVNVVENLAFIWHVIRASENLLAEAIQHSTGDLQAYFKAHLEEERGHAEWLAEDLRSVGVEIEKEAAPIEAITIVGSIYYLIFHVDACALLGYMKVLESWPMDPEKLRILGGKYPAALLRTARYHAQHDPDHVKEIEKQIMKLTLPQKVIVFQTEAITRVNLTKTLAKFDVAA